MGRPKRLCALLGVLLISSCAGSVVQRAEIASEAKSSMIGMTKERVLACMGAPTQQAAAGETEVWSYPSGGDTNSFGSATTFGRIPAAARAELGQLFNCSWATG